MIIVKLKGGLGNQMFQYAAGKRLSLIRNTVLKLDLDFLRDRRPKENFTPRDYSLDCFNIKSRIATEKEIKRYRSFSNQSNIFYSLRNYIKPYNFYFERDFHYNPEVLGLPKNTYLDGYFQCEKYFKDIQGVIRNEFTFKKAPDAANQKFLEEILITNSVGLHIRRGDFVSNLSTNLFHGICSIDYYYESMEYLRSKLKNPIFYIFSDDMDWVKQNLIGQMSLRYVDINKPENGSSDLRLMANCKHNIIANSSFSWWGAWLNQNPGKLVIAPQRWFSRKDINSINVIPESWIRL